jgi:hypothetical protein
LELDHQIVNVAEYDLAADAAAYVTAIRRLAERTAAEGHPGVLHYRFYVDRDSNAAGATIIYQDANAWQRHHEMAYQWPEMGDLQATVRLKRLALFGPITPEVEEWLTGADISYTHYPEPAALFARSL